MQRSKIGNYWPLRSRQRAPQAKGTQHCVSAEMGGVCLQYKEQRGEAQGKFRKGGRDQITQQFEGQKNPPKPVDFPCCVIFYTKFLPKNIT